MHDESPAGLAIADRTLAMWREYGKDTHIEQETINRKFWEQVSASN